MPSTSPGTLDPAAALAALRTVTTAMVATVRDADPTAAVPACPGWDVTTLVDHLGRVHLWAAHCAREARQPDPYPRRDRDQPLSDWYAACAATIVDTLAALPHDHRAWSFSALPQHQDAGFWRRRQVHETAVHQVDALQATGARPRDTARVGVPWLSTGLAADGVAEVFEVMAPRSLVRRSSEAALDVVPAPAPVAFSCDDVDASWTVRMADGQLRCDRGVTADAVGQVSGGAVDLYLALWHRVPTDHLTVSGDEAAVRRLLAATLVP
jgi:uncharacterized protein (TIGR03083 family)